MSDRHATVSSVSTRTGLQLGAALAIVISWTSNGSLFWALVHALFGWIYVVYALVMKEEVSFF